LFINRRRLLDSLRDSLSIDTVFSSIRLQRETLQTFGGGQDFKNSERLNHNVVKGSDVAAFRSAARKAKLTLVGQKSGFLLQGADRPGTLAEVIGKLAAAAINITACDAIVVGEGRYGALLWVKPQDVQKAARVLGALK
jgi:hypothetical protein